MAIIDSGRMERGAARSASSTNLATNRFAATFRASAGCPSKAPFLPCLDVVINPFSRFWPPDPARTGIAKYFSVSVRKP
jgi:hypothetical protein